MNKLLGARFFLFLTFFNPASFCAYTWAKVGLESKIGTQVSTQGLMFHDELGHSVSLETYLNQGRPLLLTFVYFDCPGACTLLLNGLVEGLKNLPLDPGRAFDVVVVSIDPDENFQLAQQKKTTTLGQFNRPGTESGWHFLTGNLAAIEALSKKLGFYYEKDFENNAFIHPSALFFLTEQGKLSTVMTGIQFSKKVLRIALVEAGGGQLGTWLDQLNSICYAYLPHSGWLDRPSRWLAVLLLLVSLLSGGAVVLVKSRIQI